MQNSDYQQILATLNRYARGCDRRDWSVFEQVFTEQVQASYGGFGFNDRQSVIDIIKNSLGGCGPTPHLLGNDDIQLNGDCSESQCYVRASHCGLDEHLGEFYEVWGQYNDRLQKIDGHWLITHRVFAIHHEIGSRKLLKPAAES